MTLFSSIPCCRGNVMFRMKVLLVSAASLLVSSPAFAESDLSGVWQIDGNASALRTLAGKLPSFTTWGRAQYNRNKAAFARGDYSGDLTRHQCASPGVVRMMTLPYPIEFFQRPFQLTMLFGWNHQYRLVNLRPKPAEIPYEIAFGVSNGHWEKDVLVIRTTDLTDNTLLDSAGLPHGDRTVVTERIRLIDQDHLENVVTVTDPKAYKQPWSFRLAYRKTAAKSVAEDVCLDRRAAGGPAVEGLQ